ncbi:helix-turn-helix domain-containing protein [Sorangium sp. So ce233]|uniref:TetR/AcrR family transcriptional regulator n=1 Tax=Sorangium sp. So ce233 TaxID=3133290 RepID=UPI003F5E5F3C
MTPARPSNLTQCKLCPMLDTVSSKDGETRGVILEAARRLGTEPGRRGVSMAEIASAAGVSRQAVYLHFETRTQLLVALLAWRDRMRGFTGVCAGFVARLQAEGALADEWSASDAADFLATILSIGSWQELIEERSWSRPRYVRAMRRSVEQSLLRPMEIKTAPRRRS